MKGGRNGSLLPRGSQIILLFFCPDSEADQNLIANFLILFLFSLNFSFNSVIPVDFILPIQVPSVLLFGGGGGNDGCAFKCSSHMQKGEWKKRKHRACGQTFRKIDKIRNQNQDDIALIGRWMSGQVLSK